MVFTSGGRGIIAGGRFCSFSRGSVNKLPRGELDTYTGRREKQLLPEETSSGGRIRASPTRPDLTRRDPLLEMREIRNKVS